MTPLEALRLHLYEEHHLAPDFLEHHRAGRLNRAHYACHRGDALRVSDTDAEHLREWAA